MSDFQIVAQPVERFSHLFSLNDEALAAHRARRITVDQKPAYPCRVSLEDAEVGEQVILVPYWHHDVDSPYRSSGPIFVRVIAQTANVEPNQVPHMLAHRLLSMRAYDGAAMMTGSTVVQGERLASALSDIFNRDDVAYVHLHNAGPGCFNCLVTRA